MTQPAGPNPVVTERLVAVQQLFEHRVLPALRLTYPEMTTANLFELCSSVALSGAYTYGGREFVTKMLSMQIAAASLMPAVTAESRPEQ